MPEETQVKTVEMVLSTIWKAPSSPLALPWAIGGEPDPKFGKAEGRRGTEGLNADSYVKIPAGLESGLRLWA